MHGGGGGGGGVTNDVSLHDLNALFFLNDSFLIYLIIHGRFCTIYPLKENSYGG